MASPAILSHDSGNPQSHGKGCTSASCCSPSKLWRTLQTLISTNNKLELSRVCQDKEKSPHILRVLLTSRLTNDPSQYPASHKHRVIRLDPLVHPEAIRKFGKSVTDLNAVQLALFHRHESIALQILTFIRHRATSVETRMFVQHVWGNRNTSLHLASYLAMPRLVKLLLELGADPIAPNARQLLAADVCSNQDCLGLLQKAITRQSAPAKAQKPPAQASFPAKSEPTVKIPAVPSEALKRSPRTLPIALSIVTPRTLSDDGLCVLPKDISFPLSPVAEEEDEEDEEDDKENEDEDDEEWDLQLSRSSSISTVLSDPLWPLSPVVLSCQSGPIEPPEFMERSQTADENIPIDDDGRTQTDQDNLSIDPIKPKRHLQVRFDPKAILVDACVEGNLGEVSQAMDAMLPFNNDNNNDDDNDDDGKHTLDQRSLLQLAHLHGHKHIVRYLLHDTGRELSPQSKDGDKQEYSYDYLDDWPQFEPSKEVFGHKGYPSECFEQEAVHPCQLVVLDRDCLTPDPACWPENVSLGVLERRSACQIIL